MRHKRVNGAGAPASRGPVNGSAASAHSKPRQAGAGGLSRGSTPLPPFSGPREALRRLVGGLGGGFRGLLPRRSGPRAAFELGACRPVRKPRPLSLRGLLWLWGLAIAVGVLLARCGPDWLFVW